ncbi:MAG: hypothetical protein IJS58_03985 [Bacilli bacterium]|nr:hypothetical protein [Bacilli bacterium]
MKRIIIPFVLIIFILSIYLVGCTSNDVVSTYIDLQTIPEEITAYDFEIEDIKIIEKLSDGTINRYPLLAEYLDQENLDKFNLIGSHLIKLNYKDKEYSFNINVLKGERSHYRIKEINVYLEVVNQKYELKCEANVLGGLDYSISTSSDYLTSTILINIDSNYELQRSGLAFNYYLKENGEFIKQEIDYNKLTVSDTSVSYVIDDLMWSPFV